jgi:hypothetical protein
MGIVYSEGRNSTAQYFVLQLARANVFLKHANGVGPQGVHNGGIPYLDLANALDTRINIMKYGIIRISSTVVTLVSY